MYGYYIFKEDVAEIYFANYYQSKSHKQRCKIKKLLYKAIGKCRIKTPRRALESSLGFLTVLQRWEWMILVIWTAHFILFLFCKEPAKKIYYAYSWTSSSRPRSSLSPRARTLWLTPKESFKDNNCSIKCQYFLYNLLSSDKNYKSSFAYFRWFTVVGVQTVTNEILWNNYCMMRRLKAKLNLV